MSLFLTLNRFYTFFSVSFVGFEQGNVCWVTILLKAHSQVWKFFLQTESSLAVMKNAFYFTLKGFFVLKIFRFLC